MSKKQRLPVFMQDSKTSAILKEAKSSVPPNTEVYMVGGAVRNAVYFRLFGKELPQRDYDLVLVGDMNGFISNLRSRGFVYSRIRRKNQIVLKKKKVQKPVHEYKDYIFLDIHLSKERDILKSLRDNSNFTINGFALPLNEIDSEDWYKKLISLPAAVRDLKNKKLRINSIKHPAVLFACIRFMSIGFEPPPKKEVKQLLEALSSIEKRRYERNIKKLFNYVGGEKEARRLAGRLGIRENIFDFDTVRRLRLRN